MTQIDPAEYALGLLDGADLAQARRLEAEDPAFAAEVRSFARVGTRLDALEADEWDAVGPPPLRLDVAAPQAAPRRRSWLAGIGDRVDYHLLEGGIELLVDSLQEGVSAGEVLVEVA